MTFLTSRSLRLVILLSLMSLGVLLLAGGAARPAAAQGGSGSENGVAHRVARLEALVAGLQAANAAQQAKIDALSADLAAQTAKVVTLEAKTRDMSRLVDPYTGEDTVRFSGVNLQVVSGSGSTDVAENGTGNVIIGYNEPRGGAAINLRTGSHNLIVGALNNYTSHGGLVSGIFNTISGRYASVTGGNVNTANGLAAVVSGGRFNTASGEYATVAGGAENVASNYSAAVSGGFGRLAVGFYDWVGGGLFQDF